MYYRLLYNKLFMNVKDAEKCLSKIKGNCPFAYITRSEATLFYLIVIDNAKNYNDALNSFYTYKKLGVECQIQKTSERKKNNFL